MSFIVSFRGQFTPYELPDTRDSHRIRSTQQGLTPDVSSDEEEKKRKQEFEKVLKKEKNEGDSSEGAEFEVPTTSKAVKAYQQSEKVFQKHKKAIFAKDIMSSPVNFVREGQTIDEVTQLMEKYHHRHIPVLNKDDVIIGIITERDLLRNQGKIRRSSQITDFMKDKVLTARDNTRIQDIARIMLHEEYSALPIIDLNDKLSGIITLTNILEYVTRESLL